MYSAESIREINLRSFKKPFDIVRTAHLELQVTDLARSREWYVDVLGFVETAADGDAIYLRGLEEAVHHSLVLRRADRPAVGHLAFKVSSPDDLEMLERVYRDHDLPTRWVEPGEEPGQGRALRVLSPTGLPVEFVYEMEKAPRLLQQFHLHRGAFIQRIDHFNVGVPDIDREFQWWTGQMGFRVSEFTDTDAPDYRLWAAWLHRKPNVHDIALSNLPGPQLHHVGFWAADTASILRACDVLASTGHADSIERGPGRHGLSNAFFLYLRDPDGHRVELYTGDYLTADPDGEPLRWSINDPRRQTFWGQPAPRSWFEELSPVRTLDGSTVAPVLPPSVQATVPFVRPN